MLIIAIIGAIGGVATIHYFFKALSHRNKVRFVNTGAWVEGIILLAPFSLSFVSASETTAVIGVVSGITMSYMTSRIKENHHKVNVDYQVDRLTKLISKGR